MSELVLLFRSIFATQGDDITFTLMLALPELPLTVETAVILCRPADKFTEILAPAPKMPDIFDDHMIEPSGELDAVRLVPFVNSVAFEGGLEMLTTTVIGG
jgi:hypothetical protein